MYASVTQVTVPHFDDDFSIAQETFERNVVPQLRKQTGYEGAYFMGTNKGEGLVITLWEDETAANASENAGPLADQIDELTSLLGHIDQTAKRFLVNFADHPLVTD